MVHSFRLNRKSMRSTHTYLKKEIHMLKRELKLRENSFLESGNYRLLINFANRRRHFSASSVVIDC